MGVSTTTNRVSFTGNGVTTAFSFPYKFLLEEDLVVVKRLISTGAETVLTLTTDYTTTGESEDSGGTVTLLAAPSSLYELIIYNDPDLTQEVNLEENDSSPAEVQEGAFDKLTLLIQRLSNRISRAVRLSDGFAPTFDMTFPVDLDDSAGKVPIVNDTGDGWADAADWPSASDIADAEENAAAAAASATAAGVAGGIAIVALTGVSFPYTVPASSGNKCFNVDLSSGVSAVVNFQLPAPVNNLMFFVKDIKGLFGTYGGVKFVRNGSEKIENVAADYVAEAVFGEWVIYSNGTDWFFK